jgi:hypothetical protein
MQIVHASTAMMQYASVNTGTDSVCENMMRARTGSRVDVWADFRAVGCVEEPDARVLARGHENCAEQQAKTILQSTWFDKANKHTTHAHAHELSDAGTTDSSPSLCSCVLHFLARFTSLRRNAKSQRSKPTKF